MLSFPKGGLNQNNRVGVIMVAFFPHAVLLLKAGCYVLGRNCEQQSYSCYNNTKNVFLFVVYGYIRTQSVPPYVM